VLCAAANAVGGRGLANGPGVMSRPLLARLVDPLSSAPIEPFDPSLPSGWPRRRKGVA
jgi:hypothetical protein